MTNQELLKVYSAYLPYGVEFICFDIDSGEYEISTLNHINIGFEEITVGYMEYDFTDLGGGELLMCLRPLSDLTNEIEHNGEKFVPALELVKEKEKYKKWNDIAPTIDYDIKIVKKPFGKMLKVSKLNQWVLMLSFDEPERSEYFIIQKLLEWHFDVYGLLDKNSAINLNEVK